MRRSALLAPCVLALALLLAPQQAAAAPWGVTDFFGNSSSEPGAGAGEFAAKTTVNPEGSGNNRRETPRGVAVNDTTGDVYVADTDNNRIQRFSSDGNFI